MDRKGYCFAVCSGISYGLIPILVIGISRRSSAPGTYITMMRMLIAGVILFPVAFRRLKKQPLKPGCIFRLYVASVFMSVTAILLYSAFETIPAGIGIILHYTHPMLILVISALFFHETFPVKAVAAVLLSIVGVASICDVAVLGPGAGKGMILALVSSVTFSGYLLWVEKLKLGELDPLVYTAFLTICNAANIFLYNSVSGLMTVRLDPGDTMTFAAVGVLALTAVMFQMIGIRLIGSVNTAILGTLEPITCTIGSALVLGDQISLRMIAGTVLVLAAVLITVCKSGENRSR